jgi:putative transposase
MAKRKYSEVEMIGALKQMEAGRSAAEVTRELEGIVGERGIPEAIRCHNGLEFTSRHILAWAMERKIAMVHIEPGRPMQNGHVESFHGKLRDECLNVSWFGNLFEARGKIGAWRKEYNEERPHSSLGYLAPWEFARRVAALRSPTAPCAPQLEELNKEKIMSSRDFGVV